ncbi:two-component regulator propeller domain-containing protein [Labilibaculum sp.]|uniref:two-component regulator propeller domain-containing protein n=1 Tax=Labilibaculum sp. TaxID=2060723 RepID=UPI002AA6EB9D|nr:two-component regulator propeller domain-containing protein [Labilibaculum sp.]MBN2596839.1 response regulator [Marinifilaceae bacterium]
MRRCIFFSFFILLSFCSNTLIGETQKSPISHIRFHYLNNNNGLAQNTVDCILQDSRGFMWFGTWNGLCRYDGYTFTTYNKTKDLSGIPDNFIQSMSEDSKGNIWIGTKNGLSRFLFNENRFSLPENIKSNLNGHSIPHISIDKQNKIWVATEDDGVWLIEEDKTDSYSAKKITEIVLPNQHISHILIHEKIILIGTENGLVIVDKINFQNDTTLNKLIKSVANLVVNCIFVDTKENVWIGTSNGLYQYEPDNKQIYFYTHQPQNSSGLNHIAITEIVEDNSGTIIVGTLAGLNFFDPSSHSFYHLGDDFKEDQKLNNPFINSLLADKQGNIWIGTDKGGVNFYNIYQKPFYSITHTPLNPKSISHNTINSILSEKNILWIGTAGGGLNRIVNNGENVDHFNLSDSPQEQIGANFITSIYRNSSTQLWLGTWGDGLKRLKSVITKNIDTYRNNFEVSNSLCSNFVSSITELDKDQLLIGTLKGLDLFNIKLNTFTHLDEKMKLSAHLEVGCILNDQQNKVWIGTRNGLFRIPKDELNQLDKKTSIKYDAFFNQQDNPFSLPGNYIISLFESKDGTIWIGTYGNGICKYTIDNNGKFQFITYNDQNGLCNNVTYAIEEDKQGNLWISTDNGLSKFNPKTESFQNYFVKDGLLSNQFYWSASAADENGKLYFGGIAGLNYFMPENVESYHEASKPVFTEFSVFNRPVEIGQEYHSNVILNKSISETNSIELSYKDAVFSIEFSALDYFLPEKIKYSYQMEGVDKDWVNVPSSRRFANYTNLSGGEYKFMVKASNSDGMWSDKIAELKIKVHPPFWQTMWFQFTLLIAIVLIIISYIQYRTRFLKEQKRKLENQVLERTEKIEEQKDKLRHQAEHLQQTNQELADRQLLIGGQKLELEIQNKKIAQQRDKMIELNKEVKQVNQLRLRFFTNISHEFRTPLTLIIDPLEQLMKKLNDDQNTISTLKIIDRNAKRLLHLINRLIYFRQIENEKMDLLVSKGNLNEFLHDIFESFENLAQHMQMKYHFEAQQTNSETWFDAEKLENIFYNLLSNAFKYTPENGEITMKVKFVENDADNIFPAPYAYIEVTDNGKGIAKEHLPFIFERFYHVESERELDKNNSGIGLALTSEIIKILHGKIQVQSEIKKGSCFQVYLPYTTDRYNEKDLDRNNTQAEVKLKARVDTLVHNMVNPESNLGYENTGKQDKSKPLVLIVEDNFDLRTFLMQTLKEDYRILGAENGNIGFKMAKKHSPDLVISDVMMPVLSGIELCKCMKKEIQTSHIPIILLTAKNMVENWVEGLETGADDYISKPFNLQLLQIRMKNLIESRMKLKRMFNSSQNISAENITSNPVDEEFINKVYRILEKNYTNPDFTINQFASEMFVSSSLLYKKLKAITDLNITNFINAFKLKKAMELIQENKLPISDIAFAVGFNDPKYFSRVFRKHYGMSPSDFTHNSLKDSK